MMLQKYASARHIKEKVNRMIIWNIFDSWPNGLSIQDPPTKRQGVQDQWYVFMLNNVFNALCYHSRELHRFLAIGITPKELISADYYVLNHARTDAAGKLVQYCKVLQAGRF